MRFTVKDLLKLEILKNASVIAGKTGLDNDITGVTIIEAPDIAKYIGGGEVLLTSLYPFSTCTRNEYKRYLEQLCEKGISAMILKVGRPIKSAEKLILLLTNAMEKRGIPIIKISLNTAYKDITYPIMERLFNEEATKLKYFKETHDRFMSLSLALPFSGSGFKKILNSLSELIGNPAALFDKNMSCLVTTDKNINHLNLPKNSKKVELNFYSKYTFFSSKIIRSKACGKPYNQIIIPLNNVTFNMNMYMVIAEVNSPIDQLDYIAIENAITAILLEFTKHRTVLEHEKEFKNNLLEQILGGKIRSRDKLNLNANLLGLPIDAHYCVLVFSVSSEKNGKAPDYNTQIRYNKVLYDSIAMHFDNIHVQNNSNNIVVVQEADVKQDKDSYMNSVKAKVERVRHSVCGSRDSCIISVGIGNTVNGVVNIPKSFKEANDTLFLIETIESLTAGSRAKVACFSELGVLKMLTYFDDPAILNNFIPDSLKELCSYRKSRRDDLLATLCAYLDNKHNIAKTAQVLFVHYKTVTYRINKIKSITNIDFDNSAQVLSIQLGLVILRMIENYNKSNL